MLEAEFGVQGDDSLEVLGDEGQNLDLLGLFCGFEAVFEDVFDDFLSSGFFFDYKVYVEVEL